MLTKKRRRTGKKIYRLRHGTCIKKVAIFNFPNVTGLENVSAKLHCVEADSLFSALEQAFRLRPIETEEEARKAERLLEYIDRAFEEDTPAEIDRYRNVLLILIQTFEDKHYIRAADGLDPANFLKLLLKEDNIPQKDLVPDCFKSESQISEFLNRRKGRTNLSYVQAVALGRRFQVDPLNFVS